MWYLLLTLTQLTAEHHATQTTLKSMHIKTKMKNEKKLF